MQTRSRSRATLPGPQRVPQPPQKESVDKETYTLKFELGIPDVVRLHILNDISQQVNHSERVGESLSEDISAKTARREALAVALADNLYKVYIQNTTLREQITFERWCAGIEGIIWRHFIGGTVNWFNRAAPKLVLGQEILDAPRQVRPQRNVSQPKRFADLDTSSTSRLAGAPAPVYRAKKCASGNCRPGSNQKAQSPQSDDEDIYSRRIERLCIHVKLHTCSLETSCYLWLATVPDIQRFMFWVKTKFELVFDPADIVKVQVRNKRNPEKWLDTGIAGRGKKRIRASETGNSYFRELIVENLIRRPGGMFEGTMNIAINIK